MNNWTKISYAILFIALGLYIITFAYLYNVGNETHHVVDETQKLLTYDIATNCLIIESIQNLNVPAGCYAPDIVAITHKKG